jgi:L-2-hydroxyglutarate oxidase LhgO
VLKVQTVIVGAGIVGLAVARQLALSGREVLVLERADRVGTETSSRNSEVIHSGIYYQPGSHKARLCVAGRDQLYTYCDAKGVPYRRTGKLIVATSGDELPVLQRYSELAGLNKVGEVTLLTADEVRELEPEVKCVGALHVPYTGIVDSHALMTAYWSDLQSAGGEIAFRSEVLGGRRRRDGKFELDVAGAGEKLVCRELVNSAGLHAPDFARKLVDCVADRAPHAYYARGHYFALTGRSPFARLIYPVANSDGLGTHATLDLAGRARFGPDVQWIHSVDYAFDLSRRASFVEAIRRYYPALDEDRLQQAYTGIRPKITAPGSGFADFRIDEPHLHGVRGLVHLYGIESPGLTSALALSQYVAHCMERPRRR